MGTSATGVAADAYVRLSGSVFLAAQFGGPARPDLEARRFIPCAPTAQMILASLDSKSVLKDSTAADASKPFMFATVDDWLRRTIPNAARCVYIQEKQR